MAKANKSNKPAPSWRDMEFINFKLTVAQREEFNDWLSNENVGEDTLVGLLLKGYKVSVSHDDNNDCCIGSLTCRDETSPNYNKCITSRHPNWWEAIMMSVFKSECLSDNGIWNFEDATSDWG